MVTITRSANGASSDIARALEGVVRELLADAPEPLDVQFGTWTADDGRAQYVCRVEERPASPFGGATQWRWWSPLVDGPEQLHEALSAAVQARRRTDDRSALAAPAASRSVA
jgi:hypothetical protein